MQKKKFHKEETIDETPRREKPKPLPKAWQDDIRNAVDVMNKGGVILYPTDTIWGLGCDATNPEAVKKIYEIKRRIDSKALITLVDSDAKVQFYVRDVPAVAWGIVDLSTKPTTIIYDGARNLAPNLIAEDGSVGIRITSEPFSKQLCFRMRRAVVSTSANISGEPAPRTFKEIPQEIIDAVDYVCTSRRGEKKPGAASCIIKIGEGAVVKVIRN